MNFGKNLQHDFPKMRGGQRPFGTFTKIHPFLKGQASLSTNSYSRVLGVYWAYIWPWFIKWNAKALTHVALSIYTSGTKQVFEIFTHLFWRTLAKSTHISGAVLIIITITTKVIITTTTNSTKIIIMCWVGRSGLVRCPIDTSPPHTATWKPTNRKKSILKFETITPETNIHLCENLTRDDQTKTTRDGKNWPQCFWQGLTSMAFSRNS